MVIRLSRNFSFQNKKNKNLEYKLNLNFVYLIVLYVEECVILIFYNFLITKNMNAHPGIK
jgi:hypothetical protein